MRSVVLACIISFLLLVLASIGLIHVAFVVVTVQGQSMLPTLDECDRVLVWRFWPARWLRRGQIVIIEHLGQRLEGYPSFIKRITGLPGDKIITSIYDLSDHVKPSQLAEYDSQGQRIWYIPPGHLFVQGDNRLGSVDSLSWGPVPFQQVGGVVLKKLSYHNAQLSRAQQVSKCGFRRERFVGRND